MSQAAGSGSSVPFGAQDAMAQGWFTTDEGLPDVAAIAATAAEVLTGSPAHHMFLRRALGLLG